MLNSLITAPTLENSDTPEGAAIPPRHPVSSTDSASSTTSRELLVYEVENGEKIVLSTLSRSEAYGFFGQYKRRNPSARMLQRVAVLQKFPTSAPETLPLFEVRTIEQGDTHPSLGYLRGFVADANDAPAVVRFHNDLEEQEEQDQQKITTTARNITFPGGRRFVVLEVNFSEENFAPTSPFEVPPSDYVKPLQISSEYGLSDADWKTREEVLQIVAENNNAVIDQLAAWDGKAELELSESASSWLIPVEIGEAVMDTLVNWSMFNGLGVMGTCGEFAVRLVSPTKEEAYAFWRMGVYRIPGYKRRVRVVTVMTTGDFLPRYWWEIPEEQQIIDAIQTLENVEFQEAMRIMQTHNRESGAINSFTWMICQATYENGQDTAHQVKGGAS